MDLSKLHLRCQQINKCIGQGQGTVAGTRATELAKEGDSFMFDNQGATEALPCHREWAVVGQDFQDVGCANLRRKHMALQWILGPRVL